MEGNSQITLETDWASNNHQSFDSGLYRRRYFLNQNISIQDGIWHEVNNMLVTGEMVKISRGTPSGS